jgi:hypothetical protein
MRLPATLPAFHFKRRTVARLARFLLDYVTIKFPIRLALAK